MHCHVKIKSIDIICNLEEKDIFLITKEIFERNFQVLSNHHICDHNVIISLEKLSEVSFNAALSGVPIKSGIGFTRS